MSDNLFNDFLFFNEFLFLNGFLFLNFSVFSVFSVVKRIEFSVVSRDRERK
jgi:hypothetical protein